MKFCFSFFVVLILCKASFAEKTNNQYLVKTRGITIGELKWDLYLNEEIYKVKITLKSKGILSKIYSFEGKYLSSGVISNKALIPKTYNQIWITKKKKREVSIKFDNSKIVKLTNIPKEKEELRINIGKLEKYSDPLTSFLSILIYNNLSPTIDGRRAYILNPQKNQNITKIMIEDYRNLWADHKKNGLEYIEVFEDNKSLLPNKINIKFEGSVFSIIQN